MNEKEILLHILDSLYERYRSLEKKLSYCDENDDRYPTLLHGQMQIVRAIQNCIAQLADPKRAFVTEREWRREFAKAMEILGKIEAEKTEHVPMMTHKGGPQRSIKKITALRKSK